MIPRALLISLPLLVLIGSKSADAFVHLSKGQGCHGAPPTRCLLAQNVPAESPPLSGLVSDMLLHYKDQPLLEETPTAAADKLPQADKYGIYRILNEDQLE